MTLRQLYEQEAGEKAMYRKPSGADYHTLRYVIWLEDMILNIHNNATGISSEMYHKLLKLNASKEVSDD